MDGTSDRYDVFISYRRRGGSSEARLIQTSLEQQGLRAFLDVEDLRLGHFDEALLTRIAETPYFILILSPNCLARCADEDDWLRQEIAQALRTNRKIVPVLMPGFTFPDPETLPPDIRDLWTHNGVTLSHEFYDATIARILEYLNPEADAEATVGASDETPPRPPSERGGRKRRRRFFARRSPTAAGAVASINPLLTEFDERYRFGRMLAKLPPVRWVRPSPHDTTGFRLALTFCLIALTASVLSIFGRASTFTVNLRQLSTNTTRTIHFGYLYELNAAFFYLILAPIFIFFTVQFIYKAHYALQHLTVSGQLTTKDDAGDDPLALLGATNRRIFRPSLLVALFLVQFLLVVGTEFRPRTGDYYKLAFGYVQAPFIQTYGVGSTLKDLQARGREIADMEKINQETLGDWRLEQIKGGPAPGASRAVFWLFLFFALLVQVLFLPLAIWIVLKGAFLLFFVYRAVEPNPGGRVVLNLDFKDQDKAFGLADLNNAYKSLLVLVFIGAGGMATAVFTNYMKGTSRIIGAANTAPALGLLAQSEVALLPLILMVIIAVSLLLIYMKAEAARVRHIAELDREIAEASPATQARLEQERKLAYAQSPWPDFRFRAWFGATLPTYVCPSLILTKYPGLLGTVFIAWQSIVDAIERAFHIFMN
jgi:hypothetical protein